MCDFYGELVLRKYTYFWVVATQIFFIFTPKIREDEPNLTSIFFSDGLVQPPTKGVFPYISLGSWTRIFPCDAVDILQVLSQTVSKKANAEYNLVTSRQRTKTVGALGKRR